MIKETFSLTKFSIKKQNKSWLMNRLLLQWSKMFSMDLMGSSWRMVKQVVVKHTQYLVQGLLKIMEECIMMKCIFNKE